MDKVFIRAAFYIAVPDKNATQEEWMKWLKKDDAAAKTAKAQFSHSRKSQQVESTHAMNVAKIRGVYRQVPALGFIGQEDAGQLEPIVEAEQEDMVELVKSKQSEYHYHGSKTKAQRRKDKKLLRQRGLICRR